MNWKLRTGFKSFTFTRTQIILKFDAFQFTVLWSPVFNMFHHHAAMKRLDLSYSNITAMSFSDISSIQRVEYNTVTATTI